MRLQVKHITALIELLSVCDDETLQWMGVDALARANLDEVFEGALAAYEEVVGYPHELAEPSDEDDAELRDLEYLEVEGNA